MAESNSWRVVGERSIVGRQLVRLLKNGDLRVDNTLFLCCDSDTESNGQGIDAETAMSALHDMGRPLPDTVVYLSSQRVYGMDAGHNVNEDGHISPTDKAGPRFARVESLLTEWAKSNGARLIIVRAANIFGDGVDGEMLRLFNRVIRGHYVHVRGNDASLAAVTSVDVAKALIALANSEAEGIYNLSDGNEYTWLQLAEAMTANVGTEKRMTHLPPKWVKWIVRLFGRVPIVAETMSEEALSQTSRTLTLDNTKLRQAIGLKFHNTLDVIARRDKTYPYKD
ncbi:MAG: sugar nucleotide-binding protein [Muribaculaceae bacterium]|nr:sugar nucleotide-binding protein [Muribaculaceae bacterium]